MKWPLKSLQYLQYLVIRFLIRCYDGIPARKTYGLGYRLAGWIYPLLRSRRRLAMDNILQAGVTADVSEADRIARASFCHFAGHICEAMKVSSVVNAGNWREHIVFEGDPACWHLLMESLDQPILLLTGHHGAWEAAVTIIPYTRPMVTIARTMNNPFVERFIKESHFRGNITVVSKNKGLTAGVLRLWQQQKAALTIVMDQYAGPRHGIRVDFMGRPAYTHTSPARIHLSTGVPILVGSFIREGLFRYRMVAEAPIQFTASGNTEKDIADLTTQMNQRLGNLARRFPEQYLWAHKRWKA